MCIVGTGASLLEVRTSVNSSCCGMSQVYNFVTVDSCTHSLFRIKAFVSREGVRSRDERKVEDGLTR